MQDHINKRIPTLLTIMLTEAQSGIENSWVKRKKARNTQLNGEKKKPPPPVSTLVLVHVYFTYRPHSPHVLRNVHSDNEIFGIFAEQTNNTFFVQTIFFVRSGDTSKH